MKTNRKSTLEIESITGEGMLILTVGKLPSRKNRHVKYRLVGIKPSGRKN